MILVADSGSTKTDWCFYENKNYTYFATIGVNPMIHTDEYIKDAFFKENIFKNIKEKVKYIFFYGAGCSSSERNMKIWNVLQAYFTEAKIQIEHDMLAAIIAIHGNADGIACIIGTGSNSILQKNNQLIEVMPSLGYILGDEAGGVDLGKKFLIDFLYNKMPKNIQDYLRQELMLNKEIILNNVYQNPSANKYMASFVPHLIKFRSSEYVQRMLEERFTLFFDYHITCFDNYNNYPIGCIGSIANIFADEMQIVAKKYHTTIDKFLQKPIDALLAYHIRNTNA